MKKREQKSFKDGYISFNIEDIAAAASCDQANAEAYEWLIKAMKTSSKVQKKNKKGQSIDIDDIYPVTSDETEKMIRCLNHAEQNAGDPEDSTFQQYLGELRGIVNWSSTRHRTFQWILIAGVIVTLFCISLLSDENQKLIDDFEADKALVEAWTKQDTTVAFEHSREIDVVRQPDYSTGANRYKVFKLAQIKSRYGAQIKNEARNRASADTATTDKRKENYLKGIESAIESQKKFRKEYEELNEMEYKQIVKMAEEQTGGLIERVSSRSDRLYRWSVFFLILIPIYIFSQRPYGYTITRLRLESKILGGLQRFLFAMAGGMASAATVMEYAPDIIVHWSNGSTTQEADTGTNLGILAMKLMLYLAALAIFCGTSCFLMTYLTVQGLRRNYNWDSVIAKARVAAANGSRKSEKDDE